MSREGHGALGTMGRLRKYCLTCLGLLFLSLGVLGIFLPLLPTTPFLLLAAFFFARSSKRLHRWLINHRIIGRYLEDYLERHAMSKVAKLCTLFFLWLALSISILLKPRPALTVILVAVGLGVSLHILSLGTLRRRSHLALEKPEE